MQNELMPSQQLAYNEILHKLTQSRRRKKIFLLGRPQTGKTFLLQKIARDNGFRYLHFTREVLTEWVGTHWLESLNFQLFAEALRERLQAENQGQTILIDEADSALMLLTAGDKTKRSIFARQYFSLDHTASYVLATSVFPEEEINSLMVDWSEQTVGLAFVQADKLFVKERFFNNVGLFNLAEISNLRQMFGS